MTMYVNHPTNDRIRVTNLYGEAMVELEPAKLPNGEPNPEAGKERPAYHYYKRWLLERTADPKFCEHGSKKEGLDALELLQLARSQINAIEPGAVDAFDNEVAQRLQATILKPTGGHLGNLQLEHNWLEWSLCWKTLHKDPPVLKEAKA